MTIDSDDEPLTLSSHALAALAEFNAEKDAHQKKFESLKAEAESMAAAGGPMSMDAFAEDWNESQFWYSDETATLLAKELLDGAVPETTIVVISAPSVFVALKNLAANLQSSERPKLVLLEHDSRFSVFPEFVFYDFQQPLKLPAHLEGAADRIICDPPFLSEDCQTKGKYKEDKYPQSLTVRWLAKTSPGGTYHPFRLLVCTGERMEDLVCKLYKSFGLKTTTFEPVHARGLSNEFYSFANFECGKWKWR